MKAIFSSVRLLNPSTIELVFKMVDPPEFRFTAGQFIMLTVPVAGPPGPAGQKAGIKRAYSIYSSPLETKQFVVVSKLVSGGPASEWFKTLRGGETAEFTGPNGKFVLPTGSEEPLCFIATGTGVAPCHSMLATALARGTLGAIGLWWGVRHEEDIFYQDVFESLTRKHPNFRFVLTLSKPGPGWHLATGRVTACLPDILSKMPGARFFLCGGMPMIQEVSGWLQTHGVAKDRIHNEVFFVKAAAGT